MCPFIGRCGGDVWVCTHTSCEGLFVECQNLVET